MSSLRTQAAQAVLQPIHTANPAAKAAANARFKARRAEQTGRMISAEDVIEIYGDAPMSIALEVGELHYALAFSERPATIIEFGTRANGYASVTVALDDGVELTRRLVGPAGELPPG